MLRAAREHGIPPAEWLDLSTGISPHAWPVPPIPADAWRRLPDDDDGLAEIAAGYYGTPRVLPVAGAQAAIQMLPRLRGRSRVGVITPGYAEHAQAWRRAGHDVELGNASRLLDSVDDFDVLVLIHPNNPTGERFTPQHLLQVHAALAARDGWLVVDEAFMDATPDDSLCAHAGEEGLVVLRSVGKFFGLAGARAGFTCASRALLDALREALGPWTLAGPTRHVLARALGDREWQARQRELLKKDARRSAEMLKAHALEPVGGCVLFQWCPHPRAASIQYALAQRGILVRHFDDSPALRFGLPPDDTAFARLDAALDEVMQ